MRMGLFKFYNYYFCKISIRRSHWSHIAVNFFFGWRYGKEPAPAVDCVQGKRWQIKKKEKKIQRKNLEKWGRLVEKDKKYRKTMKNKKESEKRGVKPRRWVYFFEKQIRLNCTVRVHVRNLDISLSLYIVIYVCSDS